MTEDTNQASAIQNLTVPIDALRPHPRNYKSHPEAQLGKLSASIARFGQVRSVVVQQGAPGRYLIVAGHGFIEAARREGLDEIRADVIPATWDDAAVVGYLIADNETGNSAVDDLEALAQLLQEQADAGYHLESLGSSQEELDALLEELTQAALGNEARAVDDPDGGGDDFDTTPDEGPTRTQVGDLWQLGDHRLLCGDSTSPEDMQRLMDGEQADCVFTSPPYAVGIDYGEYEDTIENLRAMLPKLSKLWLNLIVAGGFAVVNFGDIAPARNIAKVDEPCEYPMALEYWPIFRADGWLLWSRRIWCKPNARVNSMWCISSNRAAVDWEHVWTWHRPGSPILSRVDGEFNSCNGWFDSSRDEALAIGKDTHGAGMPLIVAARMLAVHSRDDAAVLEPFAGTGTTIIAGHRLGRRVYACELSPRFSDLCLARWEAETGQTAVLLSRLAPAEAG